MSEVRVYCPIHGLIKTIEMDCMWVGKPPVPEIDNAFCPKCGSPTNIKRSESSHHSYNWTSKDENDSRRFGMEIDANGTVRKIIR